MEKIHLENIIKSFFLGLLIGVILQLYDRSDVQSTFRILAVLASGSIGFIIGFITEWATSLLPVHIAKPRMYFFINNLVALMVTALLMAVLIWTAGDEIKSKGQLAPILWIVAGIICAANTVDYMMYRRAQQKLETFKKRITENKL